MQKLIVDEFEVEVDRKQIKNMNLGVYPPDGRIRVSAPSYVDDNAVRLFIQSKKPWILRQIRELKAQEREQKRQYVSGESHYVFGKRYLLRITEADGAGDLKVNGNTQIELRIDPSKSRDQREAVVQEWYRSQLKDVLLPLVDKWSRELGVKVDSWEIRRMKTKWGTCKIEGRTLLFNLELAKQPYHCIEFIVAHELIHLIEHNHNVAFFDRLKKVMPNWEQRKAELNKRLPFVEFEDDEVFESPRSDMGSEGQPEA